MFGMPLADLMKQQKEKYNDNSPIPRIVSKCFDYLIPKYRMLVSFF